MKKVISKELGKEKVKEKSKDKKVQLIYDINIK